MSILKYFKHEFKCDSCMPNPTGPLSKVVPSEGIKAANEEVSKVMNSVKLSLEEHNIPIVSRSRGPYERFTPEEKARIGKRAAEHRVASIQPVIVVSIIMDARLKKAL